MNKFKYLYVQLAASAGLILPGSFTGANANEMVIKNLAGLDSIAARCIISTNRKFAADICETLVENAKNLSSVNGIEYSFSGAEVDGKEQFLPANDLQSNPLFVDFNIRGTAGKSVAASIRITAYTYYHQAIEKSDKGVNSTPRSGKLVLWEKEAVANGPSKRIGKVLSAHMTKKLKVLIQLFAQRDPK